MPTDEHTFDTSEFRSELGTHDHELGQLPGWIFEGVLIYAGWQDQDAETPLTQKNLDFRMKQACNTARFAGARGTNELEQGVTHVLVGEDRGRIRALREKISVFKRLPRMVTSEWIEKSWQEKTLLAEERFAPV